MKTLNIIIAFCFGLMLGYFFFTSHKQVVSVNNEPIISEAHSHLQTLDSIKLKSDLHYQLLAENLKKQLDKAQHILIVSKTNLIAEEERVNQLLFQLKSNNISNADTLLLDSLHFAIQSLNLETDTIAEQYEDKLKITYDLVAIRDTQLVMCNKSYNETKSLMEEQLVRERQLTTDLNSTLKELRKKRNQNKVLCAGMLFIAGLTTALFIKARQ
jgi:hypothetical protein